MWSLLRTEATLPNGSDRVPSLVGGAAGVRWAVLPACTRCHLQRRFPRSMVSCTRCAGAGADEKANPPRGGDAKSRSSLSWPGRRIGCSTHAALPVSPGSLPELKRGSASHGRAEAARRAASATAPAPGSRPARRGARTGRRRTPHEIALGNGEPSGGAPRPPPGGSAATGCPARQLRERLAQELVDVPPVTRLRHDVRGADGREPVECRPHDRTQPLLERAGPHARGKQQHRRGEQVTIDARERIGAPQLRGQRAGCSGGCAFVRDLHED